MSGLAEKREEVELLFHGGYYTKRGKCRACAICPNFRASLEIGGGI